jgi:hypothetical protein
VHKVANGFGFGLKRRHCAAAPADEIELDGITDFVGTWTTTNAWQVFKFNSDSVLATQRFVLL